MTPEKELCLCAFMMWMCMSQHACTDQETVSRLLASLRGFRNALRLQDLHRVHLYLLSHLSSPKEEFYRNNGPRF